jgi:hypothetical protein
MAEETHEKNHNFSSAKNVTIEVDRKIHRFPHVFGFTTPFQLHTADGCEILHHQKDG